MFIPVGLYHWTRHQLTYGTPLNCRLTMRFFERFGFYYNGKLNEARCAGATAQMSTYRSILASSGTSSYY
ncbi:MAG TPA: hypothetical protein VF772_23560, partial [Terriglobales bacterium]